MVGYDAEKSFGKPSRSEELGTPEEQEEHTREVRASLGANAPKRMVKPPRSDGDDTVLSSGTDHGDELSVPVFDPPERMKYLQLLATGVPLQMLGSGEVDEDYTESEYYTYMAAIDKDHHTTGTGFIKVDKTPYGFHLHVADPQAARSRSFQCNPAMNDWEPAQDRVTGFSTPSTKPPRSESEEVDF